MKAPLYAYCWRELAAFARWMHGTRVQHYPAAIQKGSITAAEAARGIAAMDAIARLWDDAAECRLPDGAYVVDQATFVAELRTSCDRFRAHIEAKPLEEILSERLLCAKAMLWWHERFANGPLHMVEGTHMGRAMVAAQPERMAA